MSHPDQAEAVLRVEGLDVDYHTGAGTVPALREVSLTLHPGEALGLVGESGSGKTTLGMAVLRYLPANGRISGGRILFQGTDLVPLDRRQLVALRGNRIAMVYQNPTSALNPTMRIGHQVAEVYRQHLDVDRTTARSRAEEMLDRVALPDPAAAFDRYPHQFSGGQRQRIVIAMALAMDPQVLILDEPTTGLDVTVEAEIIELFAELRSTLDAAVLFISHDIGLVGRVCERVGVLYRGELVETGPTAAVFAQPTNPYTRGLLASRIPPGAAKGQRRLHPLPVETGPPPRGGCLFEPRCDFATDRCRRQHPALFASGPQRASRCFYHHDVAAAGPSEASGTTIAGQRPNGRVATVIETPADVEDRLLEVRGIRKVFGTGERAVVAVAGADLSIAPGRILGIVGESGSGKTTLARMIAGLETPDDGRILLDGTDVTAPAHRRSVEARRSLQMVFQHPEGTLNPSHRVGRILRRQMRVLAPDSGATHERALADMLEAVHLGPEHLRARPRELSGGQQQRVAIARAFCTNPRLVILDEPTSALDVSLQAAILNLLIDLQQRHGASYLLISHDLATVRYLADDIVVMRNGEIVEHGPAQEVFDSPRDPYTRRLLAAVIPLASPVPQDDSAG